MQPDTTCRVVFLALDILQIRPSQHCLRYFVEDTQEVKRYMNIKHSYVCDILFLRYRSILKNGFWS